MGIFAVLLILLGHFNESSGSQSKSNFALMSVWFGYAAVDILLKCTSSLYTVYFDFKSNFYNYFCFIDYLFNISKNSAWHFKNTLAGLMLGVLNFSNIALYVKAHILLKDSPTIVFASMNILVVLLGIVCGVLLYKEKLKLPTIVGIILGISGLVSLALAMK